MRPKTSYTIWFSQRNGSSLLCEALKATGIAGKPGELFNIPSGKSLLELHHAKNYHDLQQKLWEKGSTENGVFGIKANAPKKEKDGIILALKNTYAAKKQKPSNLDIWSDFFPNGKHIFLTRRNKVRQAVSWWKAIVTNEWHRGINEKKPYDPNTIRDKYNFDAIKHLLLEINFREAKVQAFLDEGELVPLSIFYEDFVREFEQTIERIIQFLGLEKESYIIPAPYYKKLADVISDEWEERFRVEMQKDWPQIVW